MFVVFLLLHARKKIPTMEFEEAFLVGFSNVTLYCTFVSSSAVVKLVIWMIKLLTTMFASCQWFLLLSGLITLHIDQFSQRSRKLAISQPAFFRQCQKHLHWNGVCQPVSSQPVVFINLQATYSEAYRVSCLEAFGRVKMFQNLILIVSVINLRRMVCNLENVGARSINSIEC